MGPQYSNVVYHNLHIKSAVGKKGRLLHEKGLNPKRKSVVFSAIDHPIYANYILGPNPHFFDKIKCYIK